MNLEDQPCEKCDWNPGWARGEHGQNYPDHFGMKRCDCEYTRKLLDHVKRKNDYRQPVISTEHATICAEMMATIPFFPGEPGARIAIADEIASMAENEAQAAWIARRMIRLYSRWPGLAEMRRVFWRTHRALDGIEPIDNFSEHFPSGIPQENPNLVCIAPGLTQQKRPEPARIAGPKQSYLLSDFIDEDKLKTRTTSPKTPLPTQDEIDAIKAKQDRNRKESVPPGASV